MEQIPKSFDRDDHCLWWRRKQDAVRIQFVDGRHSLVKRLTLDRSGVYVLQQPRVHLGNERTVNRQMSATFSRNELRCCRCAQSYWAKYKQIYLHYSFVLFCLFPKSPISLLCFVCHSAIKCFIFSFMCNNLFILV